MLNKLKALLNSSSFIRGSLIYILGSIFLKGVAFILIPLYTIVFTPADYGTMELINTIMSLLIILVSFGFSQLIYIEYIHLGVAEKISYIKRINFSFNVLALPLLVIAGIILYFFQESIFSNRYSIVLIVMMLTIYGSFFQNNMYTVLQLDQKPKLVTYNKAIVAIILLVLNILFVKYLKVGIIGVYLANLIAILTSLALLKRSSSHTQKYLGSQAISKNEVRDLIKLGFPFIITSLAYFGINGIDRFIIKSMLGKEELGLYSLGFKFGSMLEPLLIAPILSAYNPHLFKKFSTGDFRMNILRNSSIILAVFFVIGLILPFLAKFIIDAKFYYSLNLIPIFVMGFAFLFLSQMLAAPLLYFKKKKALVYNVVIASVVNVILNVILIKIFKLHGSAFAFLVTNIFWFGITLYQAQKINQAYKKTLRQENVDSF